MIEKLVTSKTRIKILKLFLSHIDDRYYLRELERMLDESLSPLRRQLVKLTNMGILIIEEEANLKYYRLNKNFEGLEELKGLILGKDAIASERSERSNDDYQAASNDIYVGNGFKPFPTRQFRYDLAILSFVSMFVLVTAMFVVYANNKNIKQVARLILKETVLDSTSMIYSPDRSNNISAELTGVRSVTPTSNGEMMSKKWKVMPGNIPVLSSGGTGEDKKSEEL